MSPWAIGFYPCWVSVHFLRSPVWSKRSWFGWYSDRKLYAEGCGMKAWVSVAAVQEEETERFLRLIHPVAMRVVLRHIRFAVFTLEWECSVRRWHNEQ